MSDADRLADLNSIKRPHVEALERACEALDKSREWPDSAAKELVLDLIAILDDLVPKD